MRLISIPTDARSTRLPRFYCHPPPVLIERIEALRNILEPDSVRSSIAAAEFQDTDCGSDAVIFHSQTHLISVGLRSDPQVAWTGLRSQAVLQRILHNGLKHQRGNLLHGDRRVLISNDSGSPGRGHPWLPRVRKDLGSASFQAASETYPPTPFLRP